MCGIAGYFGPSRIPPERVGQAQELMRRRGPDAEGAVHLVTRSGRHVHLLHSRLSIIDLDERANQPFAEGGGHLVYNGEIYNYRELRAHFGEGRQWLTSSDTEVLACLLARDGWSAYAACEGMWAAAWFDATTDRLVLSRDRFGEKPLYLVEADGGFYFGSEVKFIFALMGRRLPIDTTHLKRYLVNGYKSLYKSKNKFFEGLRELSPGHVAVIDDNGRHSEHCYWTPRFARCDEGMSYEDAVAGTRERLIRSVEMRLRADVPIAFCLSGGIDSNALVGIAKNVLGYDVHGFSIMNSDSRYEEADMIAAAVRYSDVRHTVVPVETTDFLPNLRTLLRYHDAPVYTITYYAQWRLMEAIKQGGYKVSVSGTAADELFSGYYDHHIAYLAAMRAGDPASYEEALKNWREMVAPVVRNPYLSNPDYFVKTPSARDHILLDADIFSSFLHEPWSEPLSECCYTGEVLRNRMANELLSETVPVILHEDDLNSMFYSIENRSPFLDTALFDWSQKIPTRHLIRNGRAKAVLRDAIRGIAPDSVIDNPRKVGFNVPILDYLDVDDPDIRAQLLDDSPIYRYIRRDAIETLMGHGDLANSQSKFLFYFICAKMFLEEFAS